jgi:hypothetical protein
MINKSQNLSKGSPPAEFFDSSSIRGGHIYVGQN